MSKVIRKTDFGLLKFKNETAITSKTVADALGVSHRNMLKYIQKAEKYERKSSVQSTLETAPLFGNYTYESRGKSLQCKLMNESAILILIKVVDTQEAYDYFKILLHNFGLMELEREARKNVIEPTKTLHDTLQRLQQNLDVELPLKDDGKKSKKISMIFNHIHVAVNKTVTGKGRGIERDTLGHHNLEEIDYLERMIEARVSFYLDTGLYTAEEVRADALDILKYLQKDEG